MHGIEALGLLVPFEQGKIDNPQGCKRIFIPQPQTRALPAAAHKEPYGFSSQDQLISTTGRPVLHRIFRPTFSNRLPNKICRPMTLACRFHRNGHRPTLWLLFVTFDELGQFIELLTGICRTPFGTDTAHILGTIEHHKIMSFG